MANSSFMKTLKKYSWIAVITMLITAAAGIVITKYYVTDTFESTSKIWITSKGEKNAQDVMDNLTASFNISKDYRELIVLPYILDDVLIKLGLESKYSAVELAKNMKVRALGDSRVLEIYVKTNDAIDSINIANKIPQVLIVRASSDIKQENIIIVQTASLSNTQKSPVLKNEIFINAGGGLLLGLFIIYLIYLFKSEDVLNKRFSNFESTFMYDD